MYRKGGDEARLDPPRPWTTRSITRADHPGKEARSMTRHHMAIRWLAIALATTLGATTALYAAQQQQLVDYHWGTAGAERKAMQVIFDELTKKNPTTKIVDN